VFAQATRSLSPVNDLSFDRGAFWAGARRIFPLAVPGAPFGFVIGVLIAEEDLLVTLPSWMSSVIIFAGSSQLAALSLLAENASAMVVVTTVLLINSRHFMYSAALRDRYGSYPLRMRLLLSYVLIDQQFAVAETAPELAAATPRYRLWHFLGGGAVVWFMWQVATTAGLVLGDVVKEEWGLSFAVPLLFLGLLVLSIRNRPGLIAGLVGAGVAVGTQSLPDLPQGSGLLIAIIAGMLAGAVADQAVGADTAT